MALVALGVTGGIGAYKAVEIARGLGRRGHDVAAILTRSARRFVGAVTFEAITQRRVITSQWAPGMNADIEHIALASSIDLLLVAPATAHAIAKFALGVADDFLSTMYLASRAPVLMAPAMNTNMLEHAVVQQHIRTLEARGVFFVEPGEGFLACGWIGKGRLAEPDEVVEAAERLLSGGNTWRGRRVLVTAGPTFEDLDPVRYVGNRSSGRMGMAIAADAARRGASVTLVLGPTSVPPPPGVEVLHVRSAGDMHREVLGRARDVDVVVMAAAVADYTPVDGPAVDKITKRDETLTLTLARTPDILADLARARAGRDRPVLVGFAAETRELRESAQAKLVGKGADLIVANDVSRPNAGFDVDTNEVTLISVHGTEELPLQPKRDIAREILNRVDPLLVARAGVDVRSSNP
ncbi:MAG: bifunctional phosphopantothenoylcysteine decarboxylase/phosphopantothenate--cysteine ligase CoaBC [Luteitalea sp.]|nr:bifunctional phosphopantothenoylcysteine decarboxylase/phosphopantothenate--cysteine ligase CoaBC [Luteitalea sp.]